MLIKSIISKTLTSEEKKLIRRKKVRQITLVSFKVGQIAALLEVNKERASFIFKAIKATAQVKKSATVKDQNANTIYAHLIQDEINIQDLGIGISGAVNNAFDYSDVLNLIPSPTSDEITVPKIDGIYNAGLIVGNAIANQDLLLNGIDYSGLDWAKESVLNVATLQGHVRFPLVSGHLNNEFLLNPTHHPAFDWREGISASLPAGQNLIASINSPLAEIDLSVSTINKFATSITPELYITGIDSSILASTNVLHGMGDFLNLNEIAINPLKDSFLDASLYPTLGIGSISAALTTTFAGSELYDPKIGAALSNVSLVNKLAEASLANVNWPGFGEEYKVSAALVSTAKNDFIDFTVDYRDVLKSIEARPNWVYEIPSLVELSSNSFYTQSRMVEMISADEFETSSAEEEIDEQNSSSLKALLHRLDPDMIKMWEGAVHALKGNNPDYLRHFTVSIRELYTHITHLLSPENEFLKWDSKGEFLHEGKPTREGRLHYINRNLHGSKKEVSKFLQVEVKNTIELMVMLNGGTHGINSRLTKPQLKVIKIKAEQIFVSLLQIEFSINRVN